MVVFSIVIPSMSADPNGHNIAIPFIVALTAAIYNQRRTYEDETMCLRIALATRRSWRPNCDSA